MRYLMGLVLSVFILQVNGQSFMAYQDTVNHFSINIPTGWTYGVNKNMPSLKLITYRTPLNEKDTSRDNFNINIIETPNKSLDKSFSDFSRYIADAKNFAVINKGDTTINGVKFKWLVETHENESNGIQMHNYVLVTLKDGKTYILTFVTFSRTFDIVKPLFDKIAASFIIN